MNGRSRCAETHIGAAFRQQDRVGSGSIHGRGMPICEVLGPAERIDKAHLLNRRTGCLQKPRGSDNDRKASRPRDHDASRAVRRGTPKSPATSHSRSRARPGSYGRRYARAGDEQHPSRWCGQSGRHGRTPDREIRFAADSLVEGKGFELVWGFSCQAVVLGCADSFLFGAGKAVFVPSPATRFPERAEGVKGPKC
jgi:hypothetical protein